MTPSLEQIIQSIQQLSAPEQEKVRQWLEERREVNEAQDDWQGRTEKFRRATSWIDSHRQEYLGQWVCLDGDNLISHGTDAKKVYTEAKDRGIKIPFVQQVREEDQSPFWGGWD